MNEKINKKDGEKKEQKRKNFKQKSFKSGRLTCIILGWSFNLDVSE